ncbi:MAG: hypothetical protein J6T19_06350 [Paludibacteraceae bacterium]|nr:hypothetical protein [Paludibacteraceae bacterium]
MKKIFSFLLLGLLLSVGNAWAETAGFTLGSASTVPIAAGASPATTTTSGSASETWNIEITGTWNSSSMQGTAPNKSWQMGKNGGAITSAIFSTSGISGTITSIVVTCSSYQAKAKVNCTVNGSAFGTQGQATPSWTTVGNVTFNGSASGEIEVTIDNSASGARAVYLRSITVTYSTGGSELADNDLALTDAPIALNFDLYNNSDPQVINYTTSSTGAVSIANSEYATFTINQNNKTITVTPTAVTPSVQTITVSQAADETYKAGSATFTISIANSAPVPNNNISDITAAGTYNVQGTIVAKSQRGFIVGDGTGYVYYYNQNYTQADYNIGDIVKLSGQVVVYGGVFEFNSTTTITAATESSYVAENPTVLTGAQMDSRVGSTTPAQLSNYVQYQGILTVENTRYNITSIDGATTAIGSISYPINTDFTSLNGKVVTVKGYYVGISTSTYYNTMIGSIEEVPQPTISFNPNSLSVDADEHDGTIDVSYHNFTLASAEVILCDAEGAAASYSWLVADIDNQNNIYYIIDENEGVGRTAYMKVVAMDSESNIISSSLITVTQGACLYATLPFAFDGGRADVENTPGLTQDGLDSDYGSSPKLKFNTTGDYLVLRLNEAAGVLTFDVKGNSFAGGTFSVQVSNDGSEYSNLDAITTLASTTANMAYSLAAGVRYIKWIYTEKSAGNVALGNIKVRKPAEASITLGTNGWSTYAIDYTCTLSGAEVYKAAYNEQQNAVVLTEVENAVVPANAGIILKGTEGATVTITPSNAAASDFAGNELVGVLTPTLAQANWYVLATNLDGDGLTKFHNCYAGIEIPANKAYMVIGEATAPSIRIIEAGNEATDIQNVEGAEKAVKFMENGQLYILKNGVVYDAMGKTVR